MDISIEKSGAAIPLGEECGLTTVIVEQPAHFSVESPIGQAFPARLFFTMRHASM